MTRKPPARVLRAREGLVHAMRADEGTIGPVEGTVLYCDDHFTMTRSGFHFETPGGVRFGYRLGESVVVEPHSTSLDDEARLYLWGTVFGAVVWLQGLVPLHASAVTMHGRTIALSADSGGGKSTLAAALSRRGWAHVCDDTLPLAEGEGGFWGIPDGKPMKLWDNVLVPLCVESNSPIATVPGKNYVAPTNPAADPAPLTDLVFLKQGEGIRLERIEGGAKLDLLAASLYRGYVHAARAGTAEHAQLMLRIAGTTRFWRLTRPMREGCLAGELDMVASTLTERLELL